MRSRAFVTLAALAGALVSGGWLLQRGLEGGESVYSRARLFDEVMSHIERHFVDSLSDEQLYKLAVDGMLDELNDPYSAFLTPERLRKLNEATTGTYGGLGIQIDVRDGWITVITPLPGTPAERAGIQSGDRIVAIEGKSTQGWTADEALKALRGTKGTRVKLSVERPGVAARLPFQLVRSDIRVHSVQHPTMLTGQVGYLDVDVFSEATTHELRTAITDLRRKGMKTLMLDMRHNPGGLLEQGVEAADLFLDRGQEIVSMRGRAFGTTRDFNDSAKQLWPDLSMIVLVNEGSASAAEIVAGALQDHDRAVIIGATTFGKGSAQSVFAMPGGGALKLTTARWYTPVGRSIQKQATDSAAEGEQQDQEAPSLPDTTAEAPLADRIPFRTDGGRTVYGGGGITPDLIVADTERAEAELAFERALGKNIPRFRDALTEYALSLKTSKALASPAFTVTEQMHEDLRRLLGKRGIKVDRSTYEGADSLVSRLMAYEIARYVFGREVEFQHRMRHDPVVKTALELAKGAASQRDLLTRAAERRAAKREDISPTR